jgi:hypothetical protein
MEKKKVKGTTFLKWGNQKNTATDVNIYVLVIICVLLGRI